MPAQLITPELRSEIDHRYGLRLGWAATLTGGYECRVWRVASDQGPLVVRVSPGWRTADEIAWTHRLARFAAEMVPEVVAPLSAADGSTVFLHRGQPVALFPFMAGETLDRERAILREEAARLLARLHRRLLAWPRNQRRPPPGACAPVSRAPSAGRDRIVDPALDAWQATIAHQATRFRLTVGPMHGDYYRANLRCLGDRIIGIIDWDESAIGPLMQEVAWAAWEFAKAPTGDDLQVERAHIFLAAYRDAGGPCGEDEYRQAVPLDSLQNKNPAYATSGRAPGRSPAP